MIRKEEDLKHKFEGSEESDSGKLTTTKSTRSNIKDGKTYSNIPKINIKAYNFIKFSKL